MTEPIRVFVGCSANHEDAESQAALEYSIRSRTSRPVELTWMRLSRDPSSPFSGWDTSRWATPFSGFRWAVPELAGYHGRAIYLDSDTIALTDLSALALQDIPAGKICLSKGGARSCVSVWDCERAEGHIDPLAQLKTDSASHPKHTGWIEPLSARWEGNWNCLDGENLTLDKIDILHYSSMPHQPHLRMATERLAKSGRKHWFEGKITDHWRPDITKLFHQELKAAEKAGFLVENYCDPVKFPLYGPYDKASTAHLTGRPPTWSAR